MKGNRRRQQKQNGRTFLNCSWSNRQTYVEGELGMQVRADPQDYTNVAVDISKSYQPGFEDCIWIVITRRSARPAEQWDREHNTQIVVLDDELDLLIDTLTEAARRARADGIVPAGAA